jgi:hypothetical protein
MAVQILPALTYHARRVLLHAVNLRHGTDGRKLKGKTEAAYSGDENIKCVINLYFRQVFQSVT